MPVAAGNNKKGAKIRNKIDKPQNKAAIILYRFETALYLTHW